MSPFLEQIEQREQKEADDDPDREVPEMRIHRCPFLGAHRLTAMLGGRLDVISAVGVGSTFTLVLPAAG